VRDCSLTPTDRILIYIMAAISHISMLKSDLYIVGRLFIVLFDWNNSSRVEMSLQSDILFWCRASPSLILLLSCDSANTRGEDFQMIYFVKFSSICIFSSWVSIYMNLHLSSTCIWSIFLLNDMILQSLVLLSGFSSQRVAANNVTT
jgi:hypothetical protein